MASATSSAAGKAVPQFLVKLYQMCNNDAPDHRLCIHWSDTNDSFWVSNAEKFSRDILPLYFKHNNYASFVRQLNMYGFHRSTDPKGKVEPGVLMVEHFTHPSFVRGRQDLLPQIFRKTSAQGSSALRRVKMEPDSDLDSSVAHLQAQVDALRVNQSQLSQTVQLLTTQNSVLAVQMTRQAEILQQLLRVLSAHNIRFDDVPLGGFPDPAQQQQQHQQLLQQQQQQQHNQQLQQQQLQQQMQQQQLHQSQALVQMYQQAQQHAVPSIETVDLSMATFEVYDVDGGQMDFDSVLSTALDSPNSQAAAGVWQG